MADDWMFHGGGKTAPRQPKPGERLFEFIRASDRAPMSCELRFHGESYGWEIQFFERGEFLYGHGAVATRAGAMDWAQTGARTARIRYGFSLAPEVTRMTANKSRRFMEEATE